ncbi:MAG TPA: hypothetical protein DEG32_05665, partial [Balneolaceae bacterium]|nr:hypothetical protein [Balneolaceae bacterium]
MNYFKKSLSALLLFGIIFIPACQNSTGPKPNAQAVISEFGISELPSVDFSINQEDKIIEVTNLGAIDPSTDLSSLTATFTLSEGAYMMVGTMRQTSGETVNDFSEGVFYTIISEDETQQETYFVYLSEQIPLNYFLTEAPVVELNPTGRNPLSAELQFTTRKRSSVTITVLGEIPIEQTYSKPLSEYQIPVLGLYPDTRNRIVLSIEDSGNRSITDTLIAETAALPDFLPTPEINVVKESRMEPGMHFNEVHIGNAGTFNSHPIIFDNNGDIRWYLDLSEFDRITWPIQFNDNGTFFAVFGVTIIEFDMFGN